MHEPREDCPLEYESAADRHGWWLGRTVRWTLLAVAGLVVLAGVRETTEDLRMLRRVRQQPRSTLVPQIVELPSESEQKREVMKSGFVTLAGVVGIAIILLVRPARDEAAAGESNS